MMATFERMLSDMAFCFSDMTSLATESQPEVLGGVGSRHRERQTGRLGVTGWMDSDASAWQVPVLPVLQRSGRALDDELVA